MRKSKIIIGLGLIVALAFTSACTINEVEQLEGIIQNVDAANGKITIVTKDGKTVTLDIDIGASVETEGGSSNLETLEVGASIQVEVDEDNQVVQSIKAQQTEIEGEIVQIVGDEVTVETEDGERVTILVSENTRIELEEESSETSSALQVGVKIETRFDPESKVAFTISGQKEEGQGDDGSDQETETGTGSGTGSADAVVGPDAEPDIEDKPGSEPGGGKDIIGDAAPDGDIDIDGDGKITIVDVVGGIEPKEVLPDPAIDHSEEVDLLEDLEGDHPDDGEGDHPDDGDDHPDDGDDHPDDGEDHDDDGDDHDDDDDDDGDDHSD